MKPFLTALAVLGTLVPLAASACDVQAESAEVRRLYADMAATLPRDAANTVGAGLIEAGRLHEVGKNKEACERFVALREMLTAQRPGGAPRPSPSKTPE